MASPSTIYVDEAGNPVPESELSNYEPIYVDEAGNPVPVSELSNYEPVEGAGEGSIPGGPGPIYDDPITESIFQYSRGALEGIASVPDFLINLLPGEQRSPITRALRKYVEGVPEDYELQGFGPKAVSVIESALVPGKAIQALGKGASSLPMLGRLGRATEGVGKFFAAGPTANIAAGLSGIGAEEAVKAAGGNRDDQTKAALIASLAGGFVPGAARGIPGLVKNLGSSEGRGTILRALGAPLYPARRLLQGIVGKPSEEAAAETTQGLLKSLEGSDGSLLPISFLSASPEREVVDVLTAGRVQRGAGIGEAIREMNANPNDLVPFTDVDRFGQPIKPPSTLTGTDYTGRGWEVRGPETVDVRELVQRRGALPKGKIASEQIPVVQAKREALEEGIASSDEAIEVLRAQKEFGRFLSGENETQAIARLTKKGKHGEPISDRRTVKAIFRPKGEVKDSADIFHAVKNDPQLVSNGRAAILKGLFDGPSTGWRERLSEHMGSVKVWFDDAQVETLKKFTLAASSPDSGLSALSQSMPGYVARQAAAIAGAAVVGLGSAAALGPWGIIAGLPAGVAVSKILRGAVTREKNAEFLFREGLNDAEEFGKLLLKPTNIQRSLQAKRLYNRLAKNAVWGVLLRGGSSEGEAEAPESKKKIEFRQPLINGGTMSDGGRRENIPTEFLEALIQKESGGDSQAVSPKGAAGLMQIMPDTAAEIAKDLGVKEYDIFDPETNRRFGEHYFNKMLDRFGDHRLALAAYNWGPSALAKLIKRLGTNDYDRLERHLPKETIDYVATLGPKYTNTAKV